MASFRHWPTFVFDDAYSVQDTNLIGTAANKIAFDVYNMMSPFADENLMYKDLIIEFVSERNTELKKYNALGLAYKNKNIDYIPKALGRWMFAPYTGMLSMELTHSIIMRLLGNRPGNDIIHWLYNEGRLFRREYVSQHNLKYFGGSLTLVMPDMVYGWKNQQEIMDGIRSGKYKEGFHHYWSDPAWKGDPDAPVAAATNHEFEAVKNWLIYGRVHARPV